MIGKKKLLKRIFIIIASFILLAAIILSLFVYHFLTKAHPKTTGTINIKGLTGTVLIKRDKFGVPHIYAETLEDMFFAQGYIHAQDRFWQMDFLRRLGRGKLSELFGKLTLEIDIYSRTCGFGATAELEYSKFDPEIKNIYEAYSSGVNSYIRTRLPEEAGIEYGLLKLIGTDISLLPWSPIDSIVWFKLLSDDLAYNKDLEFLMLDLAKKIGEPQASKLFPPYDSLNFPYIIAGNGSQGDTEPDISDRIELFFPEDSHELYTIYDTFYSNIMGIDKTPFFGKGWSIGSNSWVISGDLTESGKPLLVNDPHLGVSMPSVWYEVDLKTYSYKGGANEVPTYNYNVRGASIPGTPGVIIGHNEHIAWGISILSADVQDFFVEKINPQNPLQYEYDRKWLEITQRKEQIFIQGESEPFEITVKRTKHGPILSELEKYSKMDILTSKKENNTEQTNLALALSWTGYEENTIPKAVIMINKARNFDEFREALKFIKSPTINLLYADTQGNIGYQAAGLIPIRSKGNGLVPLPGWKSDTIWKGFIPYEELPFQYNPEKGYIVAANNPIINTKNYPYFFSVESTGFRAKRIEEMINSKYDKFTIDDMKKMQSDIIDQFALETISYLKNLSFSEPTMEQARQILTDWNGEMDKNSPAALLYIKFYDSLASAIFDDDFIQTYLPYDKEKHSNLRLQFVILWLLNQPEDFWWDDKDTRERQEKRDDILHKSMVSAVTACLDLYGNDMIKWKLGDAHKITFRNLSLGNSGIPIIESLLNRGPYDMEGGNTTVNVAQWTSDNPYEVKIFSSIRIIIDLGKLESSLMNHTPGQSGHPLHKHYDDLIKSWFSFEYHSTLYDELLMRKEKGEELILKP